jgi:hypothetical protein
MARHSSATTREEISTARKETSTPEETSTRHPEKSDNGDLHLKSHIIDASLKRRARLLITNGSIPRQTRSLIRYALEIRDPYLAQVVRRLRQAK